MKAFFTFTKIVIQFKQKEICKFTHDMLFKLFLRILN